MKRPINFIISHYDEMAKLCQRMPLGPPVTMHCNNLKSGHRLLNQVETLATIKQKKITEFEPCTDVLSSRMRSYGATLDLTFLFHVYLRAPRF